MIIVMYVENTESKYLSFTKKNEAAVFVKSLVEADVQTQTYNRYLTGIILGTKSTEYIPASFDYKEKTILKKVSKK